MDPPVPATSVHPESLSAEGVESVFRQMLPLCHRPDYLGEGYEVPLLAAYQRLCFEERNHFGEEICSIPHHEHQTGVRGTTVVLAFRPQPRR